MNIRKKYHKQILRSLGHRAPRKFAYRHPSKFLKIITARSEEKIRKRLKTDYFKNLTETEIQKITGDYYSHIEENFLHQLYSIENSDYLPTQPKKPTTLSPCQEYMAEIKKRPLEFAKPAQIKFSIIIPVYEQPDMTIDCLRSLSALYKKRSDIEIIIADDSKNTSYSNVLNKHRLKHIKHIKNESSTNGFLTNCNFAAQQAQGKYIIFLNNDTFVLPEWLEGIEKHHSTQNKIVGSKLLYEDATLQEAGGAIFSDGSATNIGRNQSCQHPYFNFSRESDYVSGASLSVEKKWFIESGSFDKRYIPAYYEDTDLCVRAKQQGFSVIYSAESKIIHLEGKSCGTDTADASSIKKYQLINKEKFLSKWNLDNYLSPKLYSHYPNLIHRRKQILVVTPYEVRTDIDSGSKRLYHIVMILQKHLDVVIYASHEQNRTSFNDPWVRQLNKEGVEIITKTTNPNLKHLISERDFDFYWVGWLVSAKTFLQSFPDKLPQWIYDTVDIHYIREARRDNIALDDTKALIEQTCYEDELNVINKASDVIVVSSFEQQYLKDKHEIQTSIVGNLESQVTESFIPAKDKPDTIAFVGHCLHEPNVTSINYFLKTYWANIKTTNPSVKFIIMGNQSDQYKSQWERYQDVTVLGWVESVEDEIKNCKFTIAPLLHGAGVKGKINQSLATGIPVLATKVAAEGMIKYSEHGKALPCGICVTDIANYAQQIKTMLQDNTLLDNMSEQGIQWVEQLCGYQSADKVISKLLSINN